MNTGIRTTSRARKSSRDLGTIRWRIFWTLTYLLAIAILAGFLVRGYDYYSTPLIERPHHPDYALFRPAGRIGLGFGFIGAAMMILMLVYTVRKRFRYFGRVGTLRQWLNFHMFLGIIGPLLIVLHTSFKVQGLVAVSFWSMVLVAVSGIFGRFLYVQIPRNINGDALSLAELEEEMAGLARQLRDDFGVTEEGIGRLDAIAAKAAVDHGFFTFFRMIFGGGISRTRIHSRVKTALLGEWKGSEADLRVLSALVHRKATLAMRTRMLSRVQQWFHYWHVFHKPFAIIMYIVMLVHIGVAFWTGYTWIF